MLYAGIGLLIDLAVYACVKETVQRFVGFHVLDPWTSTLSIAPKRHMLVFATVIVSAALQLSRCGCCLEWTLCSCDGDADSARA